MLYNNSGSCSCKKRQGKKERNTSIVEKIFDGKKLFFSEKSAARWERDEKNLETEDLKDFMETSEGLFTVI